MPPPPRTDLQLCVHVEQQLVPLGARVDQLLVERQLELVNAVDVRLDARARQLVRRLDGRHL